MKKIFLFAAALVAAMSINAEQILFSEVAAKGSLNGVKFSDGDFTLTVTDTDEAKLEVDSNSCYFGDAENQIQFALRLKTGGKSSSKNLLTLTAPAAGKLYVYARTGSNSATDRNIILTQDGTELLNKVLLESEAVPVKGLDNKDPEKESKVYPALVVDVKEGDIEITYPVGAVNFYAFSLGAPADPSKTQAIDNIEVTEKAVKTFENGQLVIIKNGVRYNALGAKL